VQTDTNITNVLPQHKTVLKRHHHPMLKQVRMYCGSGTVAHGASQ